MTGDPEGTHEHACENGCGRFYVCPNDRCPGDWCCPICEREAFDLYVESLIHPPHTQEPTRDEKH